MNTPLTRRKFLQSSALSAGGLALHSAEALASGHTTRRAKHCILLLLTGGPSQLETWDPKPDAPAEVRGPFRSIPTNVTGIRIGEHLPLLASRAQHLAIVRSVHHEESPVHEAGLQLLQTGRLSTLDIEHPHVGAVVSQRRDGERSTAPPFVLLPSALGNMGLNISRGQSAGNLGLATIETNFTPLLRSDDRDRFGKTPFGDACARALHLVEQGTRCVVVNMFASVYDRVTWDCHADRSSLASTLDDYRRTLCPTLDRAFSTLLDDLQQRGMLDETLVVAMGEMGRTPHLNASGGRDHWTRCWSIALAGGGVRGGQVIGASDHISAEPRRHPVTCSAIHASILHALGIPAAAPLLDLFA